MFSILTPSTYLPHSQLMDRHNHGFTLIELAVVLVIIGLIIGGVLVGRDLIEAAKMRAIAKDIDEIKTAVQTFRLKYNCLPGDCANAESFWGSDASCPMTPANTTPKRETCNGNNNGRISDYMVHNDNADSKEQFRFWQQLADADLIEGQYSGVPTSGVHTSNATVGVNIPPSSYDSGMGYFTKYLNKATNDSWWFAGHYGNYITVGRPYLLSSPNYYYGFAFLTPSQAYAFDSKHDDGSPHSGGVRANYTTAAETDAGQWTPCATGLFASPAYDFSITQPYCNLIFANAF